MTFSTLRFSCKKSLKDKITISTTFHQFQKQILKTILFWDFMLFPTTKVIPTPKRRNKQPFCRPAGRAPRSHFLNASWGFLGPFRFSSQRRRVHQPPPPSLANTKGRITSVITCLTILWLPLTQTNSNLRPRKETDQEISFSSRITETNRLILARECPFFRAGYVKLKWFRGRSWKVKWFVPSFFLFRTNFDTCHVFIDSM